MRAIRKPGQWVADLQHYQPVSAPNPNADSDWVMQVLPSTGSLYFSPRKKYPTASEYLTPCARLGEYSGAGVIAWKSDATGFAVTLNGRYLAYHLMSREQFRNLCRGLGVAIREAS
jgi:hypothetical protein